jgi:chromosome segregation ATPase
MITVTCPRCGRAIQAREKNVLMAGGVPCLKCKVRISVSREQLEALAVAAGVPAETAPRMFESIPAPAVPESPPAPMDGAVDPVITVMATGERAGSSAAADTESTASPMATILHHEEWRSEPKPVSEKGPETLEQLRGELAEAKENAAAAEEILNRFSREKITNELALLRKNRDAEARCRELADKLKSRDNEVLALQESVQTLEKQTGDLSAVLSAKQEECLALSAGKAEEVAALSGKLQAVEKQAGELASQLVAKSDEARAAIEQKEAEAAVLRGNVQSLEAKATDLEAVLAAKTAEFKDALSRIEAEKKTDLTALQNRAQAFEKQAGELASQLKAELDKARAAVEQKTVEAAGLRGNVQSLEAKTSELRAALAAKDAEFQADLSRKEGDQKTELASLQRKIQELESRAGDLSFMLTSRTGEFKRVLDQKEGEVVSLRGKTGVLEKEVRELNSLFEAKVRETQVLSAKQKEDNEAWLKKVQTLESKVLALDASIKSKDESYHSTLARKSDEIQSLMTRIGEREEQAYKLAVEIKGWEDRMKDVAEKEGQLKALYDILELDLKKEIDTHQKLLASLRRQVHAA